MKKRKCITIVMVVLLLCTVVGIILLNFIRDFKGSDPEKPPEDESEPSANTMKTEEEELCHQNNICILKETCGNKIATEISNYCIYYYRRGDITSMSVSQVSIVNKTIVPSLGSQNNAKFYKVVMDNDAIYYFQRDNDMIVCIYADEIGGKMIMYVTE